MQKLSRFIDPGEHSVGFYKNEREKLSFIIPYLRAGILQGEKCIVGGTREDFEHVQEIFENSSTPDFFKKAKLALMFVDYNEHILEVLAEAKNPEILGIQWKRIIQEILEEGFSSVRIAGVIPEDYNRSLDPLILDYEKKVDDYFQNFPVSAVCLYPEEVKETPFGKQIRSHKIHPVRAQAAQV